MALHDELTGLPTRHLLEERAGQALALADRRESQVGVLHLDLISFEAVNDRIGYSAGDRVLAEVARRMRAVVRSTDTVARVGGDDFAVILGAVDGEEGISAAAGRLADAFEPPFRAGQESVDLECCIGGALFPDHGGSPGVLLAAARRAADRALAEGEDFVLSDPARDARPAAPGESAAERVTAGELRQALRADELEVHYQPVVDLGDGRMVGAEALVRWPRPGGRVLPAGRFVPLAEREGLIAELDRQVLDLAIAQLDAWRADDRWEGRPEWVSVNVGTRTFHDGRLADRVHEALQERAVDGSGLVLEVSERTALRDPGGTRETARDLRGLGVRLAIDDFGTGYSALAHLHPHPAHLVKIDMFFVRQLLGEGGPGGGEDSEQAGEGTGEPGGDRLVEAVIGLGHALELAVVAKGVESEQERAWLEASECDYAQGYHLGRPVPAGELFESAVAGPAAGSGG